MDTAWDAFAVINGHDYRDSLFMNTRIDEPADQEIAVAGERCKVTVLSTSYCWDVPLLPGLMLGLDFDTAGSGRLLLPVTSPAPLPQARLEGELVHVLPRPGGQPVETVLATLSSAPVDAGPNEAMVLEATVKPTPESDLVPPVEDALLVLRIRLVADRPDNAIGLGPSLEPSALPGGLLDLPLREYVDPIPEGVASEVLEVVLGEGEHAARPGNRIEVPVTLRNLGPERVEVQLSTFGEEAYLALVEPSALSLEPGAESSAILAVQVPADAKAHSFIEVSVEALPASGVGGSAVATLRVHVDPGAPEAGPLAGDGKETPAAPLALGAAALLAAGMLRRRRA